MGPSEETPHWVARVFPVEHREPLSHFSAESAVQLFLSCAWFKEKKNIVQAVCLTKVKRRSHELYNKLTHTKGCTFYKNLGVLKSVNTIMLYAHT